MYKSDFNKLIRNKIPSRMVEQNIEVDSTTLARAEYLTQLKRKIIEEANEVVLAETDEELAIELADVMEVIYAIADANGISKERIEEERLKKFEINGGFSPDCYINYIKVATDDHKMIEYLQNSKRKYIFDAGD